MVYVFLAEGFEEVEALTVVDVLRRADVETKTVAVSQLNEVWGAHDISVNADITIAEADFRICDMIVLPGGKLGTENLAENNILCDELKRFNADGDYIAAICAAPSLLGSLGILEGKRATVYPGMEDTLKGAFPMKNRVVVDGNVITSKGPGTAMDFAVEIVAILCGKEKAEELMQSLQMAR